MDANGGFPPIKYIKNENNVENIKKERGYQRTNIDIKKFIKDVKDNMIKPTEKDITIIDSL